MQTTFWVVIAAWNAWSAVSGIRLMFREMKQPRLQRWKRALIPPLVLGALAAVVLGVLMIVNVNT